jgi:hypothetical protein
VSWTPYRNLILYAYRIAERRDPSPLFLVERANKLATEMLFAGMPGRWIDETYLWDNPLRKRLDRNVRPSKQLKVLLYRKDHLARKAIEKLLLAYVSSGYEPGDAVASAWQDYQSITQHNMQLSRADIAGFAVLYWNWWLTQKESIGAQRAYAYRFLDDEYRAIFDGTIPIDEVRNDLGVIDDELDAAVEMRRMFIYGSRVFKKQAQILARSEADILSSPTAFTALSTVMSATAAVLAKSQEFESGSQAGQSLADFIHKSDEDPNFSRVVTDYRATQGPGMDALFAENEEVRREQLKKDMDTAPGEDEEVERAMEADERSQETLRALDNKEGLDEIL